MIRCGRPRWDAKDKICDVKKPEQVQVQTQVQSFFKIQTQTQSLPKVQPQANPLENDLAKLIAEREKLSNIWSEK